MRCHQQFTGRRQLLQKPDADASCLLGVVFETVVPVGVVESDREHGVAGKHQTVVARSHADHAVSRGMPAGTRHDHARRHLTLILEQPQVVLIIFGEPLGGRPKRVREPLRHDRVGEIGRLPG